MTGIYCFKRLKNGQGNKIMARIIWTIYFFIPSAAAPINFPFFIVLLAFAFLNLFMQEGADVQRFPLLFLAKHVNAILKSAFC